MSCQAVTEDPSLAWQQGRCFIMGYSPKEKNTKTVGINKRQIKAFQQRMLSIPAHKCLGVGCLQLEWARAKECPTLCQTVGIVYLTGACSETEPKIVVVVFKMKEGNALE